MRHQRPKKDPTECSAHACCFHSQAHGCRVVEGLPAKNIDWVLEPQGGFGQEACPLVELLLWYFHKASPVTPLGDSLSELFLLLKRISHQVQAHVNVGYLVRAVKHWAVDRRRQEGVRPRCGICQHYGWMSKACLRQQNPYAGVMISPGISPADLQPPCDYFRSRKEALRTDDLSPPLGPLASDLERLVRGLDRLRTADPAAEALLVLLFLEGYSQRDLARMIPCSRRRVAAEVATALRKLGLILEDLS